MGDITNLPKTEPRREPEPDGTPPAYRGDVMIYRLVVTFLGLVLLAATVGALFSEMASEEHDIPQFLVALGSGALGCLGGLLAPSPLATK